jgi:hypothetical protein
MLTAALQSPKQQTVVRIHKHNMSGFSNTDTGSKTADPYTLKEKVEDLLTFIDNTKFCLLTTQVADSDLLASRAMALAAKVRHISCSGHCNVT